MPSENRASLTALVNSKTFRDYSDITYSYQEIWNPNIRGSVWFTTFLGWLDGNFQAYETCKEVGSRITLVVV